MVLRLGESVPDDALRELEGVPDLHSAHLVKI